MVASFNPMASPPPARRKKLRHPKATEFATVAEALHCKDQIANNHKEGTNRFPNRFEKHDKIIPDTADSANNIDFVEAKTTGVVDNGIIDDTVGIGSEELFKKEEKPVDYHLAYRCPSTLDSNKRSETETVRTQTLYSTTEETTKQLQTKKINFKDSDDDSGDKLQISFVPNRQIIDHIKDGQHCISSRQHQESSQLNSVNSTRESTQTKMNIPSVVSKTLKDLKNKPPSSLGNELIIFGTDALVSVAHGVQYEAKYLHKLNETNQRKVFHTNNTIHGCEPVEDVTNVEQQQQQQHGSRFVNIDNPASSQQQQQYRSREVNIDESTSSEVTTNCKSRIQIQQTLQTIQPGMEDLASMSPLKEYTATSRIFKTIDGKANESESGIVLGNKNNSGKQTMQTNQLIDEPSRIYRVIVDDVTLTNLQTEQNELSDDSNAITIVGQPETFKAPISTSRIFRAIDIIDISSDDDEQLEMDGGTVVDGFDDDATLSLSDSDYQCDDGSDGGDEEPSQVF